MHRRVITSILPLVSAAALAAVPIALFAPAAQADHVLTPDGVLENTAFYNNEDNWVDVISEDDEFVDVECVKVEGAALTDPYLIPELADDRFYVVAVVKGGSGEAANEVYDFPEAGHYLSHETAANSHIILCSAELEDESTPSPTTTSSSSTKPTSTHPATTHPSTTKPATGPVVETDRVVDGPSAGLGLSAAAMALVAGAGAVVFGRRRQGNHR